MSSSRRWQPAPATFVHRSRVLEDKTAFQNVYRELDNEEATWQLWIDCHNNCKHGRHVRMFLLSRPCLQKEIVKRLLEDADLCRVRCHLQAAVPSSQAVRRCWTHRASAWHHHKLLLTCVFLGDVCVTPGDSTLSDASTQGLPEADGNTSRSSLDGTMAIHWHLHGQVGKIQYFISSLWKNDFTQCSQPVLLNKVDWEPC